MESRHYLMLLKAKLNDRCLFRTIFSHTLGQTHHSMIPPCIQTPPLPFRKEIYFFKLHVVGDCWVQTNYIVESKLVRQYAIKRFLTKSFVCDWVSEWISHTVRERITLNNFPTKKNNHKLMLKPDIWQHISDIFDMNLREVHKHCWSCISLSLLERLDLFEV